MGDSAAVAARHAAAISIGDSSRKGGPRPDTGVAAVGDRHRLGAALAADRGGPMGSGWRQQIAAFWAGATRTDRMQGERNAGEAVLGASRAAMREWCPHCGRKGLLRLGAKRRDRSGYTCGQCRLSFIASDADLQAIRAARSHCLGPVTPDPDRPRSPPRFWP